MTTTIFFKTLTSTTLLALLATTLLAQNHVLRHNISKQTSVIEEFANEEIYDIVHIVDGDTFYAKNSQGIKLKYRLIGINTPEFSHFGRPEQPYAQEATDYLAKLLKGRQVILKYDVQYKDKYGRELVYAYLPDGTFINSMLITAGWAQIMTIPPNVAHTSCFLSQQHQAQAKHLGIWTDIE